MIEAWCPKCGVLTKLKESAGALQCTRCGTIMPAGGPSETLGMTPEQLAEAAADDVEAEVGEVPGSASPPAARKAGLRAEVTCSGCNLPFIPDEDASEAVCPYCGARTKTGMANRTSVLPGKGAQSTGHGKPLGQLAVERGFVTEERLNEALEMHQARRKAGSVLPLGEMMVGAGYLSRAQLEVLLADHGDIGVLPQRIKGYELIKKLGEGAWGEVLLARQIQADRLVALKILRADVSRDPDYLDRFLREGRLARGLDHPNIVRAVDVGDSDGRYYMAMEYVEGRSLYDFMAVEHKLPEPFALHLMTQVAKGLEYAHRHGIVHRDLKPENILIDGSGTPKIADLGLAKETGGATRVTQTGVMMGTPLYMSPEQARGDKDVDIRSDIYSLGATLYHLVTGRPPFEGPSGAVVMTMHLTGQARLPHLVDPQVSESCSALVVKMMAKDRRDRYQTPAELIPDLELVANGKPPQAPPPRGPSSVGSDVSGAILVVPPRAPARAERPRPAPQPQRTPHGQRRPQPPPSPQPIEPPAPSELPAAERPAEGRRSSVRTFADNRLKYVATAVFIAVLSAVLGLLIGLSSGGGDQDPSPNWASATTMFEHADRYWREHPTDYDAAIAKFELIQSTVRSEAARAKAAERVQEIRRKKEAAARP